MAIRNLTEPDAIAVVLNKVVRRRGEDKIQSSIYLGEAHTYIGMDLRLRNKAAEAISHFERVKQYGNPTFYEYPLALAELERGR